MPVSGENTAASAKARPRVKIRKNKHRKKYISGISNSVLRMKPMLYA